MKAQPSAKPAITDAYDKSAIDPNTTLDVFMGPKNTITELADTVETLDGVRAETIDIANEQDGTHLEVIVLEEQATDQLDKDHVDNFVTVDGIGPEVATLLLAGGIRTFRQLANTPIERIRQILDAAGPRFRIHDASRWAEQASQLTHNESLTRADETHLPYGFAQWPNQKTGGTPIA